METFVVRIWTPATGEAEEEGAALHGVVERVGAAGSCPFREGEELLRLLQIALRSSGDGPKGGVQ